MSDGLIERPEELSAKCDSANDTQALMRATADLENALCDNIGTILSALKTVRGIEGLAKTIYGLEYDDNEWTVTTLERVYRGKTLAIAVDAAVVANEKGGK